MAVANASMDENIGGFYDHFVLEEINYISSKLGVIKAPFQQWRSTLDYEDTEERSGLGGGVDRVDAFVYDGDGEEEGNPPDAVLQFRNVTKSSKDFAGLMSVWPTDRIKTS
jgi:hypothetical protein